MLIYSFELTNGTIITPLLLFYLELRVVYTKIYRLVEYTPLKCFNNFVLSAANCRRQGFKNPNSIVAAETLQLLANSSYGYRIIDRSRNSITRFMDDEKTHAATNKKCLRDWDISTTNFTR